MNNFKLIVLIVVLSIFVAIVGFYKPNFRKGEHLSTTPDGKHVNSNDTSLGMYAEENAIVVTDQKPADSVFISKALINQTSYLVVYDSGDQKPGKIIGVSPLLEKDEYDQVKISLDRTSINGETIYVMIHAEQDPNTEFDQSVDQPVLGNSRNPILARFVIDENIPDSPPILP